MSKSKSDRDREYREAENRAWTDFQPKLAALQNLKEAHLLVHQAPPQNSPGRKYYSNLGFFLQAFTVPAGSSQAERSMYIRFIERLDATGDTLKPGAAEIVLAALRNSLSDHPYGY